MANAEFTEEMSEKHAGMTPLALACALNKLPSVKVFTPLSSCASLYHRRPSRESIYRRSHPMGVKCGDAGLQFRVSRLRVRDKVG